MIGQYVVTEQGSTFVALFAEEHDHEAFKIVEADVVAQTEPELLGDRAEALMSAHVTGGTDKTVGYAMWLERELDEGRAQIISAHFEVNV